ncbi:hypothetical protein [Gimesia maris]|uniref:hypothetical protein n=1 Tax=Gimesia maris TaxID=122 RepID=UPI0032EE5C53
MSIEAFLWNYRDGESVGFEYEAVREILATEQTEWLEEYGCLRVSFHDPDDYVDMYLGEGAPASGHVKGITIARPLDNPDYLQRVFRVMGLGDVMLFYSDETTPIFVRGKDPQQYPADLLEQLGEPRFIQTPIEMLHQT